MVKAMKPEEISKIKSELLQLTKEEDQNDDLKSLIKKYKKLNVLL